MLIVSLLFLITYAFALFFLGKGWKHYPEYEVALKDKEKEEEEVKVSVIIPVRNEEDNILFLLQDLQRQSFKNFEVIVVNDHSEDNTEQQVLKGALGLSLTLLRLSADETGKKKGLALGIAKAKGKLILTTDGDCRVGSLWLESFYGFYQTHSPKLIAGFVTFHAEKSLWNKVLSIEFLSAIGTGASSMVQKRPNMCSGANLAFERDAFFEVGGYADNQHIASGDDEFLLHKINQKYPEGVLFLKSKKAVVRTKAPQSLKSLLFQRKRWASKWKYYRSAKHIFVAVYVFLFHCLYLFVTVSPFWNILSWKAVFFLWISRVFVEWYYLKEFLRFVGRGRIESLIPLVALIYSPYVVWVALKGTFGKYEWKSRIIDK